MENETGGALIPVALLAAASGARATSGVAALVPNGATKTLALGELVADKLPTIPDRIEPRALAGRVAAGALVGAIVANRTGGNRRTSAIVGALVAFASAHASYRMRRALSELMPPTAAAVVEDAMVVAMAAAGAAMLDGREPG